MCNIFRKRIVFIAMFLAFISSGIAQDTAMMNMSTMSGNNMQLFSGSKGFRKWSVQLNVGSFYPAVAIGGSNDFSKPRFSFGYGANIKYQFTHWFALQAEVVRGNLKGSNVSKLNDAFPNAYPTFRPVSAFKTDLHYAFSVSGLVNANNINWLVMKARVVPYATVGLGLASYDPKYSVTADQNTNRQYRHIDNSIHSLFVPVGIGFKWNVSNAFNLDFGYRMNFVDADNFDGYSYTQTAPNNGRQLHKDKFSYGFIGFEFALGNKNMPQLMFDNPVARMNSNLQNQIDVLRSQLNLADTDGDGVADIFDKEPNTPAGCPVDTHGVTKDTDGDGVPDCRDKELITPTYCQPVDANGVGKCPPPECCNNVRVEEKPAGCTAGDMPSVSFKGNAATLSADAKSILASVAGRLRSSPACNITITGYPAASKASQAVCNRRTEAIKMYLTSQEGISADRITVNCQVGGGDANTIDIKAQ